MYSFTTFLTLLSVIIFFLNNWTRLRAGQSGVGIPEEPRDLLSIGACRMAVGPAQYLIQRVKGKVTGKFHNITGHERPEVE